jgi:hypothetical protein
VKQYPFRLAVALAVFALSFAAVAALAQAPSDPPCDDGLPHVRPENAPKLPPCPEPKDDDSGSSSTAAAPADAPSLPHSAPLLERARVAALQLSARLPNFVCQEFMARFVQQGRGPKQPQDIVSAELIYEDGRETYRNLKINNRPTDKRLEDIDGAWSTGEFATALLNLFDPASKAHFSAGRASAASGLSAQAFDFQVQAANSHWKLSVPSMTVVTDTTGTIWVDPNTARVLRIEMQARNIPEDFPIDTVESAIDYSFVTIEGKSYLLPAHAESLGCQRGSSFCSHNVIDFRNYHEFKGSGKIIP